MADGRLRSLVAKLRCRARGWGLALSLPSATSTKWRLWVHVHKLRPPAMQATILDKVVDTSPLLPIQCWSTLSSGRNSLVGFLAAEPTLNLGKGGEWIIVLGLSGGYTMCMTNDISKNGQNQMRVSTHFVRDCRYFAALECLGILPVQWQISYTILASYTIIHFFSLCFRLHAGK